MARRKKVGLGRTQKKKDEDLKLKWERQILWCECGRSKEVSGDVVAFTCEFCVTRLVGIPDETNTKPKEKRPRGWHLRKVYVSPSGQVYHKGRLVDEGNVSSDA